MAQVLGESMLKNYLFTVAFTAALLCSFSSLSAASLVESYVVRVIDGDTLELQNKEKVRMLGIDAPESRPNERIKRQAETYQLSESVLLARGLKAKNRLKDLVEGKKITILRQGKDKYGRTLGWIFNDKLVNLQLIEECLVWPYEKKGSLNQVYEEVCK